MLRYKLKCNTSLQRKNNPKNGPIDGASVFGKHVIVDRTLYLMRVITIIGKPFHASLFVPFYEFLNLYSPALYLQNLIFFVLFVRILIFFK